MHGHGGRLGHVTSIISTNFHFHVRCLFVCLFVFNDAPILMGHERHQEVYANKVYVLLNRFTFFKT